jgi:uncharacterized protein with HEPN domain
MRSNTDILKLERIIKYCKRVTASIMRYGNDIGIFEKDFDYFQSVTMSLMQIGENVNHLSTEFTDATKGEIPWKKIVRMRNIYAHEYDNADTEIIWNVANNDVPVLQKFCEKYLNNI